MIELDCQQPLHRGHEGGTKSTKGGSDLSFVSFVTYFVSFVTYFVSFVTYFVSFVTYFVPFVSWGRAMRSGTTHASKSASLTPASRAASRSVVPRSCAYRAIAAARS